MNDESISSAPTPLDLRAALLDRFEADAILGARALPVRLPASAPHPPTDDRPISRPPSASPARPVEPSRFSERVTPDRVAAGGLSPGRPQNAGHGLQPDVAAEEQKQRQVALDQIDTKEVKPCSRCGLHSARKMTVFGVGSPIARIMFIGEGPGADEDATGIPFVGRAGELLTRMIESGMGLNRDEVYICNIVKCRPPNNRTPAPDEIMMCKDFLLRQIDLIKPEVIISLGAPASQTLLDTREGINRLRGSWHDYYPSGSSLIGDPIPLMPTFHPAYLLRVPGDKSKSWADLKMVMARLGLAPPPRTT